LTIAAVKEQTEVELKFVVPASARVALAAEMARGSVALERQSLVARYLDTEDRRLARAGLAWRLRREGRRWIQTLKAGGSNALVRFEHEVIRGDASHDPTAHAGTPAGAQLLDLLRRARADGLEPVVRFQTEVRRTLRRIRTRGAVVEVAFDEGRLLSSSAIQRIREIEFELCSGSTEAMLALAERWRRRFGLVYDPRSKAERGDRLADGSPFPPVRKTERPVYAHQATALDAFGAVLEECLAQVTRNAIGLSEGDPALRVEHVHQMRVGIRRLRSALRGFQGWVPMPPDALVTELRALFTTLGLSRDIDVLDSGVVVELAKVGAPTLTLPPSAIGPDMVATVTAQQTQKTLLGWIAWRASLDSQRDDESGAQPETAVEALPGVMAGATTGAGGPEVEGQSSAEQAHHAGKAPPAAFRRSVERRLQKWHRRIVAGLAAFDEPHDDALHALRKRIKRQRYAVEFFAPVLRQRQVERYLRALSVIQDRMGELNDLFVARARFQALVASDAAAWFALGWLTARIAEGRARAKPALEQLSRVKPPTA
jgi:inorganic triphosphatase YgiF